jgi:hypothetical protein
VKGLVHRDVTMGPDSTGTTSSKTYRLPDVADRFMLDGRRDCLGISV